MSASIKISANTSEARKAIIDLANYSKRSFRGGGINLFDKDTSKLLSGQAADELAKLEKRSNRLKSLAAGYSKSLKDAVGDTKREVEAKQKLLDISRRLIATERERAAIGSSVRTLRGGALGQMTNGMGEALKDAPGIGKLLGIGSMGALGLAAGGALIGGGMYAYSRANQGFERYKAGLPSRLKLMGRGIRDLTVNSEFRQPFADAGMNEEDVRQSRLQAMEALGAGGATQRSVLGRAKFARNYGIDVGELTGLGAGFRAQSSATAAQRDTMKLQASLIASGVKDSIGSYLETAANALIEIRSHGLVDSGQVMSLMSALTKTSGNSPEQVAKHMTGLHSAVQGSQGDANAIFQMAFARAGIGGKTIGGIQEAIKSGGIFGVTPENMNGMSQEHIRQFQHMGLIQDKNGKGGVKDRLGAILNQFDTMFQGRKDEGLLAKGRFMNSMGIGDSAMGAVKVMDEMRRALRSGKLSEMEKAEKSLQDSMKSPQEKSFDNLEAIRKSNEGMLSALDALKENQLEYLGRQVAPAAMTISRGVLHIDEILTNVFGGVSKLMGGDQQENAFKGKAMMSEDQIEEFRSRGKMAVNNAGGRMVLEADDLKKEIAKEKDQEGRYLKMGDTTSAGYYTDLIAEHTKQLKMVNDNLNRLIGVQTTHVEVSKNIEAASKRGNKAQAKVLGVSTDSMSGK